ncbi:hypothetical protein SAMN05428995_104162 [Loktanella sp. DSM 29012]|uniref:hypothetical protein n=1 Tax=Loktanella sp. DSM 29012 TaxID=1881056 RepID=UPI0008C720F4|nr:hypothetical protein [Loktanella sp. DSM 29012]SEQ40677.1 hypothetical protein SAMN05428995_104162 [Loktanella sp. DSM 29012]
MRQIFIHPGFHKTGTSSIQHFLWYNRETLDPFGAPVMLRHMKPLLQIIGRFSRTLNPLDLMDYVARMDDAFAVAAPRSDQNIIMSCEGLLGNLPGGPGVASYAPSVTLAAYLTGYLAERFPDVRQRMILTTRDADGWLFSTYRHHLRGHRLKLDFNEFAALHAGTADLDKTVAEVAEVIAPVPVDTLPMTDLLAHDLGPGGALCEHMGVSPKIMVQLAPVGTGNAGPDTALWQKFLDLNRSPLADRAVAAEKERLAAEANLGGWRFA